ncbi:L-seryl-tRNA(Sec) selenium transferase [Cetobacterium ceti]|uniref:L-seryl-tRNA(Sec) selenium transferase n=1 Tax=Cetobacterium ceti TaxID=180163 RepID=A0A1T4KFG5_9FUSO|nr:L-seryl-tRNA(Sec) selenium transferase [Cetobacterium ceti]SJZ41083.1 L-seryl-tRNA(Sec) selenium transferase [Cetobacterium ceti]
MNQELFRKLPKVDKLLKLPLFTNLIEKKGYNSVYEGITLSIDSFRNSIMNNSIESLSENDVIEKAMSIIQKKSKNNLKKVINGTGTIIHTNLGRSVFSKKMIENLSHVLSGYNNLEYNLETGERGSRYSHIENLICEITGAEGAVLVNNNAAAVLLCLDEFSKNKEVVVSRGELVEIGGSFRIPDIMRASGSKLVEVGTTNRTHTYDYENVINENTSMLLKVHTSNYKIIGFTEEIKREEIVALGQKYNIITMEDLGSGVLVDFSKYKMKKEPTIFDSLNSGMDIVTFSGDKLLGGPQCGIIIGKKELIQRLKRNQLLRAFRVCKMTLSALEVLLREYKNENYEDIPTLSMIIEPIDNVLLRAQQLQNKFSKTNIVTEILQSKAMIGGGSMPEEVMDSFALSFPEINPIEIEKYLRTCSNPIVGRVQNNRFMLDLKTIFPEDFDTVVETMKKFNQ